MPSPLDLLLDPVSLVVFALYAALMLWELCFPARSLPHVRGWQLRGLAAFAAFFFLSSYLPLFWGEYLQAFQLFDLPEAGPDVTDQDQVGVAVAHNHQPVLDRFVHVPYRA